MNRDVLWSTGDVEWATPPALFEELDREFWFRLDAAANQSNHLVPFNWYGPDHPLPDRRDALVRDWADDADEGAIFCNPPYGAAIGRFMAKASEAAQRSTVVCLVPARVDTRWFQDYCLPHEVRFLRGRLRFNGFVKAAPFPSCVVVMDVTANRHCARCRKPLSGRSDARFCSGACRMAAHRAKQH